jgi:flagellar M-ring protein FliF
VGNELPGAQRGGDAPAPARDQNKKSEEIVNYEISRTTKTEVIEGGRVKRVSAAVLVDGVYSKNEKGESVYQPRAKEEIDRIAALVRSAIGFDQKRGDQVEVVNLRFAEMPVNVVNEPAGWLSMFEFTKADVMRGVELLVLALVSGLVVLFVVRPLVARAIKPDENGGSFLRTIVTPALAVVAAPAPTIVQQAAPTQISVSPSETSKMIEIAQVKGEVHAQSIQKVGELADRNPHEAVSVIRHWLHDAPA